MLNVFCFIHLIQRHICRSFQSECHLWMSLNKGEQSATVIVIMVDESHSVKSIVWISRHLGVLIHWVHSNKTRDEKLNRYLFLLIIKERCKITRRIVSINSNYFKIWKLIKMRPYRLLINAECLQFVLLFNNLTTTIF